MQVKCAHCFEIISLEPFADLSSIHCPSCGVVFAIPIDETLVVETRQDEEPDFESLQEKTKLGGFSLGHKLRGTARSEVWLATELVSQQKVAIKLARFEESEKACKGRFSREAEILSALDHHSIVKLHSHGTLGQRSYLATELIDGETLSQWLVRMDPSPSEAAYLALKISRALEYAHDQNIVHRDLNCSNILMDKNNEPHLIDFGIAIVNGSSSESELMLTEGTPIYMAPEQLRGHLFEIDQRVDIYSLGVVFYELLTAKRPYDSGRELINKILDFVPEPPSEINSSIPVAYSRICLKCLEKDREARYEDAGLLGDEIELALHETGNDSSHDGNLGEIQTFENSRAYLALQSRCVELEQSLEKRTRALVATKSEYDVYRNLVESRSIGAFRKNLQDRFVFANEFFCRIVGKQQSEIVGHCVREVLADTSASVWETVDHKVLSTNSHVESTERYEVGSHTLVLDVVRTPVRNMNGRIIGVQGIMYDVSAHAELERTLRNEKEIAVAANLAKGEFLARMSHEVRTPMTAIIGMNQLLTRTELTDKQRDYASAIADAADSLLEVINDILDFSKIDAGKTELELSGFDLRESCEKVVRMLRHKAKESGTRLDSELLSNLVF